MKHEESDHHWCCENRLKEYAGKAMCCECDKHPNCGGPEDTLKEV